MKRLLALFLLGIWAAGSACAAQWARASYTSDGIVTFYIDIDSIKGSGSYRQAWVMFSLKYQERSGMQSVRQFMAFNCSSRQYKVEINECFTGPMLSGSRCGGGVLNGDWNSAPANSSYAHIISAMCQH